MKVSEIEEIKITKNLDSSCSFFGINFSFINLASIQFDFTIILKKCALITSKNIKKDSRFNLYIFQMMRYYI